MPLSIEFVVEGIPPSHQSSSRNRQRYQTSVQVAAGQEWQNDPPVVHSVAAEVTLCVDRTSANIPDLDNILKTILDSLNCVVYDDDEQVSDIICRKRFFDPRLVFVGASPTLIQAYTQARSFVHIRLSEASILEL